VEANDLLERRLAGSVDVGTDDSILINLRPFQVMTIRLRRW
jgi:hypothetical protein